MVTLLMSINMIVIPIMACVGMVLITIALHMDGQSKNQPWKSIATGLLGAALMTSSMALASLHEQYGDIATENSEIKSP